MNVDSGPEEFKKSGALLTGHFILSSGLHSDMFLQKALVFQTPNARRNCARPLAELVRKQVKAIHRHRFACGRRHRAGL